MSTFCELDCGGEAVTLEKTDDGDIIFHGWDEETEMAAIELGFEPSVCFELWEGVGNINLLKKKIEYASRAGDLQLIKALIFIGVDVNKITFASFPPLYFAVLGGNVDSVELLLAFGANPRFDKSSALRRAAESGNHMIVESLVKAGANLHILDDDPLRSAARYGYVDVVRVLIEYGANVHAKSDYAIRWAAREGCSEVVRLLLENGADASVQNYYALRFARKGSRGLTKVMTLRRPARCGDYVGVVDLLEAWIEEHRE